MRISGLVNDSIVDGPGLRFAIFTQGCAHHCPGCHNPHTWDFKGGYEESVENIMEQIKKNPLLDGVTLSGGDPFYQIEDSLKIAKECKKLGLTVMAYTGFLFEELLELGKTNKAYLEFLEYADWIVDGPFILALRDLSLHFRGSSNQRIIDVPHYLKTGEIKHVEL